ncbi:holo-ACP synthase [Haloferax sp. ATB1]|uniref:holo-ACP synthase n=1 Tax=Haloferax sp. ATB1 TaxID=1508454 RepID=UPI0009E55378|nr:4'-phosphopantetheinyl transferase superfamily protein [Haloferax sp. ATB1]
MCEEDALGGNIGIGSSADDGYCETFADIESRADRSIDSGSVVRHGIDLVSIERIASLLAEFGKSFRDRAFTDSEQAYCERRGTPSQHYAARWAAKEAFCKTLDAESPAIPLDSIEVVRKRATPHLRIKPPAVRALGRMFDRRNMSLETAEMAVSLSHDKDAGYAIGSVTVFSLEP